MAEITASLVKDLRGKTSAGMMDCKKALTETGGDLEAAVDWLRKNGLSVAAKKAGRIAAEGLVAITAGGTAGAVAEINAETDFVARNEQFQKFCKTVVELALANDGQLEDVLSSGYPGNGRTVAEELNHNIATIGENMSLRRTAALTVKEGVVAGYVHNAAAPDLGRIGVLVALSSSADVEALLALGKNLAMHVAASNPQAIDEESLDPALVARERQILVDQAKESGKPEDIIEKMVDGRMRKFFQEAVLLHQAFVMDTDKTIKKVLAEASEAMGAPVRLTGFECFHLGEGIEKTTADFASEVKEAAGL